MHPENQKLLQAYLVICETRGLTKRTIKGFSYDLGLFLRFLGDKTLAEVTHRDCHDFIVHCQVERKNGDQAISRKHTALSGLFRELIKKDYLFMPNPMDKLDTPKVRRKIRPHLTIDEIMALFDYLEKKKDYRALAIVSLFFYSGIRLSELHQLNRDSLDFKARRFEVLGKGEVERYCIFSQYAVDKIQQYLATRTDNLEPLFLSRQGNRICLRQIQIIVRDAVKASTGKHMTPHNLRHSAAMDLLKRRVALEKIQGFLGHKSVATTQIYAHNSIDDVQEAVDSVWEGLDGPPQA